MRTVVVPGSSDVPAARNLKVMTIHTEQLASPINHEKQYLLNRN